MMIHFEHGAVALLEHRGKRRRVEHIIMLNRVYSVASSAVQVHNCFLLVTQSTETDHLRLVRSHLQGTRSPQVAQ